MKKFWQISGTNIFGATKEELKAQRNALNTAELVREKDKKLSDFDPSVWPFRITKGPEHPSILPYFREVPLKAKFHFPDDNIEFVKTGPGAGRVNEPGGREITVDDSTQVRLAA